MVVKKRILGILWDPIMTINDESRSSRL